MIAKKNPKRKLAAGTRFSDLAAYILDARGKGAKALHTWASNCSDPSDLEICGQEITATQALNSRSERDKNYHLIVSLAPGEKLTEAQFRQVDERFCEALGLGDPQRICAVHNNTKNLHMHGWRQLANGTG